MDSRSIAEIEAQSDILAQELEDAGYVTESIRYTKMNEPVGVVVQKGGFQAQVDIGLAEVEGFVFEVTWESNVGEGNFTLANVGSGPRSTARAVVKAIKALPTQ